MKRTEFQRPKSGQTSTTNKTGASPLQMKPSMLALQQQIGNQAVLQLMGPKKRALQQVDYSEEESEDEEVTGDQATKKQRNTLSTSSSKPVPQPPANDVEEESDDSEQEESPEWEVKRPSFTTASKRAAFASTNRDPGYPVKIGDYRKPGLVEMNGAMPHRMSYNDIRNNALKLRDGKETSTDFNRWTDRFITAGKEKIDKRKQEQVGDASDKELKQLITDMETSQKMFISARDKLASNPKDNAVFEAFIKQANSFHANVPDVGPHFGVNNPVQENAHMHVETVEEPQTKSMDTGEEESEEMTDKAPKPPKLTRRLSIMSSQVRRMSIGRISAFPYDAKGNLITTDGSTVNMDDLPKEDREAIGQHPKKTVKGYDSNFKFGNQ
ncbi:hypothetical protein [Paenibacillus sp. YIM B09110]|uniref:hypothetical protein n=1 Tax=Paenibacillus sp. YIM B09110 TaxID=3126102 RepID=UPI00301E3A59